MGAQSLVCLLLLPLALAWAPAPRAPLARLAALRADPAETPVAGDADPAEPPPVVDDAAAAAGDDAADALAGGADDDLDFFGDSGSFGDYGLDEGAFSESLGDAVRGDGSRPTTGRTKQYTWLQSRGAIAARVAMPARVERAKQLAVEYATTTDVRVGVVGEDEPLLLGALAGSIRRDETFWTLEDASAADAASGLGDGKVLVLEIVKKADALWLGLLDGEGDPLGARADADVTDTVFLELAVDGAAAGRVELELFGGALPRTVASFVALCTDGVDVDGAPRTLAGSPLHRVIPGFMLQGGDITQGDGTGGMSLYGRTFRDERFAYRHTGAGVLSMANSGPDSNGSQFFVTTAGAAHLDGKHVVFGRVRGAGDDASESMRAVAAVEAVGTDGGTPTAEVTITACGRVADSG